MKQKKTIDELAAINARLEARRSRKSALPVGRSGIKGRSLAPAPVVVEVEPEEPAIEEGE